MEVSLGVAGLLRVLEVGETETAKCHSYAEKKVKGFLKDAKFVWFTMKQKYI